MGKHETHDIGNSGKRLKVLFILILTVMTIPILFQNCAETTFQNTEEVQSQYACDGSGNCILKSYATVTAGVDLPPLKMFVVVDNSYTMKANQFNLSENFQQMFDSQNSASLVPFDTTAYILNTTQYTYNYGSTDLSSIGTTLLPIPTLMSLTPSQFMSAHRPLSEPGGVLSGSVPGDVIGYNVSNENNRWQFSVAPVLGYSQQGSAGYLTPSIRKLPKQNANSFTSEFQSRLAILNPDYNPDNRVPQTGRFFPVAQDSESGMCAVSRVLRNDQGYLQQGDQAIFLIVTDEDEADLSGQRCVREVFKTDEEVVDVFCEERISQFTLQKPNCRAEAVKGYKVSYDYLDLVTKGIRLENAVIGARYRPAIGSTYKQTYLNYTEKGYLINNYSINFKRRVYSSQKTDLRYCLALMRDGVKTEQCSGNWINVNGVNGDWSSQDNCAALAKQKSNDQAVLVGADKPICQFKSNYADLSKYESCDINSSTCRVTYPTSSGTLSFSGFINSSSECNTKAQAQMTAAGITHPFDGYLDPNNPDTFAICNKAGTQRVKGSCPNGQSCELANLQVTNILVKGDFTDSQTECATEVTKSNSYADPLTAICVAGPQKYDTSKKNCSGIPSQDCVVNFSDSFITDNQKTSCPTNGTVADCSLLYGPKDILGATSCSGYSGCTLIQNEERLNGSLTINLPNNNIPNQVYLQGSNCDSAFLAEVGRAQPKFSPGNSTCKISSVTKSSETVSLQGGQTCEQAVATVCANSGGAKRHCLADSTPVTARTEQIREELNCESLCQDSKTNYCARVPSANPNTTIAEAMAAISGVSEPYSCSVSKSKNPLSGKTTTLLSDKENVCKNKGSGGSIAYVDASRTSNPYRTDLPIVEYVAGSTRNGDGSFVPQSNLKDYIVTRSDELLGSAFKPIISTFVRQPSDGNGNGGSIGTKYTELALAMDGQNTSVVTGDYAAPLRDLSQMIKDRVQRSFSVNTLQPGQLIRSISLYRRVSNKWQALSQEDYSVDGKTFRVAPEVVFEEGDQFKVEYW